MQLVGAGFPRTGTLSTKAALTRLGLPCYHMAELVLRAEHTRAWHDFLIGGKPMAWLQLFEGYEATVDAPAAFVYREILQAFPNAKVLLNVREPNSWYASLETLANTMQEAGVHRDTNPRLAAWLEVVEALNHRMFGGTLEPDRCIRVFEAHNRRVQEEISAERLLVFRVQDGWEPLCAFLGRDVPSEPFPHLNEGPDTVRALLTHVFETGGANAPAG